MSINGFIGAIASYGGMSSSNNFLVKIVKPPVEYQNLEQVVSLFCSEAQLPNVTTATGTTNGLYLGSGQIQYPHTRVYSQIQLGFLLDANLSALKFFNKWHDWIFSGHETEYTDQEKNLGLEKMTGLGTVRPRMENRPIRVRYRDSYATTILISKTEIGPNAPNQRVPITYVLEQAYPVAIDAIPLAYGPSQLTSVTVQLSYARHYTVSNDIRSVVGTLSGMYKGKAKKDVEQKVVPGSKK